MKYSIFLKSVSLLMLLIMFYSCSSTTLIQSTPTGAKVFLDSEYVGTTPVKMKDTKITGSTTMVKLESEGYENLLTSITKDEEINPGAIVGGFFFLVPFLWTMQYKNVHNYELKPLVNKSIEQTDLRSDLVNEIREIKKLLDEGLISQDEFVKAKEKIMNK